MTGRWQAAAERNRKAANRNAKQLLDDTRYDQLRTPAAQRSIVAIYVLVTVGIVVVWATAPLGWPLLAMAAWFPAFIALRLSVRAQADLPDEVLDERQRAEREAAYVGAFRLVAGVTIVAASVALFAASVRDANDNPPIALTYASMSAVFWGLFSLLLGAPSMVMALRQSARQRARR